MTSAHCDNFDVLLPGRFAWLASHTVLNLAWVAGLIIGLKPCYAEYTPTRLNGVSRSAGVASAGLWPSR